jgi:hypothetical protein
MLGSSRSRPWGGPVTPLGRSTDFPEEILGTRSAHLLPGPGGAPPQNWGYSKEAFGATPAERMASGFQPGDSCNGHSGFLTGGGEP